MPRVRASQDAKSFCRSRRQPPSGVASSETGRGVAPQMRTASTMFGQTGEM